MRRHQERGGPSQHTSRAQSVADQLELFLGFWVHLLPLSVPSDGQRAEGEKENREIVSTFSLAGFSWNFSDLIFLIVFEGWGYSYFPIREVRFRSEMSRLGHTDWEGG